MEENEIREIKKDEIPLYYKLILKIPLTSFFENAGGIFWGLIVPIFLILEFFLSVFLIAAFSFPVNMILVSIIPISAFMIFTKITLNRFIDWWNTVSRNSGFVWDVDKTLKEYVTLLKKQRLDKK